jgi:P-aminobenzoate N-oxygenase AurF
VVLPIAFGHCLTWNHDTFSNCKALESFPRRIERFGRKSVAMREKISGPYLQHIIDAARRKSFDPQKDIDWSVPFDFSHFYMPEDMVSLYGTPLWDQMDREQRVELSMHEACSAFAGLIWFENQLSFKLMDYLIDESPLDLQFYWMQIEVADECRHSMMFGEAIRRSGVPWYKPRYSSLIAFFTKYLTSRVGMMLSTLAAEEITGYLHHRTEQDPECHPVMRELSRIHILEEARHRGYAHQYLRQNWPHVGMFRRSMIRRYGLLATTIIIRQLVHPDIYKNLGLPTEALEMAKRNPNRSRIRREMSAHLVEFLTDTDIVDKTAALKWRAAGLMG